MGFAMEKIRVLVVDDSAYMRQSISRMLQESPDIEVVGVSIDGEDAIRSVIKLRPDVITLDLEMPRMDGFTFLRWLMSNTPTPVIIVSSMASRKCVFEALDLGAVDFIPKPARGVSKEVLSIENNLITKVIAAANLSKEKLKGINIPLYKQIVKEDKVTAKTSLCPKDIEIVAIGASTGGPSAISSILTALPQDFPVPIVIAQHMPEGFTRQFAERLDRMSKINIKEARNGDAVEKGMVFVAPGGFHTTLTKEDNGAKILLKKKRSEDKYSPSVDIMMSSAAEVFGPKVLGIILTGMGDDGKLGMKRIKEKKGSTIAEAEETAVIFGMPGEVIKAGFADEVVPLTRMVERIIGKCAYNGRPK